MSLQLFAAILLTTAGLPLLVKWMNGREYASVRVRRGLQGYMRRSGGSGSEGNYR